MPAFGERPCLCLPQWSPRREAPVKGQSSTESACERLQRPGESGRYCSVGLCIECDDTNAYTVQCVFGDDGMGLGPHASIAGTIWA